MRDIQRWAIYYAPKMNSALARFGSDWLGWDPQAGRPRDGLELPGLPLPREEITAAPRRYGLHGTLKPPFALAADRAPSALDAEITTLAQDFTPFDLPLMLAPLGEFLALVPSQPLPELDRLAEACVTRLDGFRAPATAEQIARRCPERLTARQGANLATWGYPYVCDDFRFHITLTGPLAPEAREATARALSPSIDGVLTKPCRIEDLCLFGEDREGLFHLLKRFPFRSAAAG